MFVWPDLGILGPLHLVIRALLPGGINTGLFSGGFGTSRRRLVIQGHNTSSSYRLQVQGLDTSRRCRLTGSRHIMSLPSTRVPCPLCGCPSASFTYADSIRCSSSVGEFFFQGFFLPVDHRPVEHGCSGHRPVEHPWVLRTQTGGHRPVEHGCSGHRPVEYPRHDLSKRNVFVVGQKSFG